MLLKVQVLSPLCFIPEKVPYLKWLTGCKMAEDKCCKAYRYIFYTSSLI